MLQRNAGKSEIKIRTALITARNAPAHERVIRTLRDVWKIKIDECFFLGGISKKGILKTFNPHIFFDDQKVHCEPASTVVPTARVPTALDQTALPLLEVPRTSNVRSESIVKKKAAQKRRPARRKRTLQQSKLFPAEKTSENRIIRTLRHTK